MSEYDDYDEFDDPSLQAGYTAASPEDEITAAYYADPVAVTNLVAQQAAAQRAHELAQAYGTQLAAVTQQYAGAVGEQSAVMADHAMHQQYGDEWVKRRGDVAEFIAQRPHLAAGVSTPTQAAELIEMGFLAVRREAQQRDDANEWQRIKEAGRGYIGTGGW